MEDNQWFLIKTDEFHGCLHLQTVYEDKKLLLIINLSRLKTWDNSILQQLQRIEYGEIDILSIVTLENVTSIKLSFQHIVNYKSYLEGVHISDDKSYVVVFVNQTVKVYLNKMQLHVLKLYIKSLHDNYFLLRNLLNAHLVTPLPEPLISTIQKTEESEEIKESVVEIVEESTPALDKLFYLCGTYLIRSVMIGFMFNNYRYFNNTTCNRTVVDDITTITSSNLLSGSYKFFKSFLIANASLDKDTVIFYIKKIVLLLKEESKLTSSPLYLAAVLFLLLIYCIRFIMRCNDIKEFEQYSRGIFDYMSYQKYVIEHALKELELSSKDLVFNFIANTSNNTILEELSEKYKYLIPLSQEDFMNAVLSNKTMNRPLDFSINGGDIIDITKYFQNERLSNSDINNLIHYFPSGENNRIITDAYKYFVEYTKNPSSIIALKDEDIPISVLKLFEILKKILTPQKMPKDLVSTMSYYKILCESLPDAKLISHQTLLYVIYQIIIPYQYDMNNITQFCDVFLGE